MNKDGDMRIEQRELMEQLNKIGSKLEEAIALTQHAIYLAKRCDSEIDGIIGGQLALYTLPTLERFHYYRHQSGAILALQEFLQEAIDQAPEEINE